MKLTGAELPQLSSSLAFIISLSITSSFFAGIYLNRAGRLSFVNANGHQSTRGRDDPVVIKARLTGVTISALVSCSAVYILLALRSKAKVSRGVIYALNWLKKSLGTLDSLNQAIPMLYAGPLVARGLSRSLPFQRNWSFKRHFLPVFTTWIGLRNYIVAPITEEIVFRACLLGVAQLSHKGLYHQIFITPLWFGAAHLHHAYELYNNFGRTTQTLQRAIFIVLVQLTYTTLFGAYASFLHIRTGSILPPITAHIFANTMGLPELPSELREHPKHKPLIWTAYLIGILGHITQFAIAVSLGASTSVIE